MTDEVKTTAATTTPLADNAGAAPVQEPGAAASLVPFLIIFVVFYFLILRPQQRKMKEHQAMVAAVRRGDKVVTSGGILGKVTKVNTETGTVDVEIADGVEVEVVAATITNVVNAAKPINDNAKEKGKKK